MRLDHTRSRSKHVEATFLEGVVRPTGRGQTERQFCSSAKSACEAVSK